MKEKQTEKEQLQKILPFLVFTSKFLIILGKIPESIGWLTLQTLFTLAKLTIFAAKRVWNKFKSQPLKMPGRIFFQRQRARWLTSHTLTPFAHLLKVKFHHSRRTINRLEQRLQVYLRRSGRKVSRQKALNLKRLAILKKAVVRKTPRFFSFKVRFSLVLTLITLVVFIYSALLLKIAADLPSPTRLSAVDRPTTTQFYDRNNKLLYNLYEGRNRQLIRLEDLPKHLIDATIAIEDRFFFIHPGLDILGIARAIRNNFDSTHQLQGGSTITQQLIKNTLLTPDKTISRKVKEIILAWWAERIYTKQEILKMYFNEVPFGGVAWGIEAASEMYFAKSARYLNLAESAYLAGLPAAPTQYSPYGINPEKGKVRQKEVLRRMVEDGYITKEEADKAFSEDLSFAPPITNIKAPHFVWYVRDYLAARYGPRTVSQGGLKVVTTLDLNIQETVQTIVSEHVGNLASHKVSNGAAMITDAKTGQILAMVGSKNYFDSDMGNFNVTLALRQPGSAIKPITYATAFKMGYTPGNVLIDNKVTFADEWGNSYSPVNYDGAFHGVVTIRTALGSSYNVPAVKMLYLVGLPSMLQTASEMGITTFTNPSDYGLSLTLGGGAVKMIDMMSVYGTLSTGGIKYIPNPILIVTDSFGNVLEDNRIPYGTRVLAPEIAYMITHILSDNKARAPAFGSNSLLVIPGKTVASKTGTSDDKRDNWVFGFSPEYVVGTWVGNNNNTPMDPTLTSGITGATPIWHDIMVSLLEDRPDIAFIKPSTVVEKLVDGRLDLTIAGQTPKSAVALRKMKKQDKEGSEVEVNTYIDSFGKFSQDSAAKPKKPN